MPDPSNPLSAKDLYTGFHLKSSHSGPKRLILVAIHGNEVCGFKAFETLVNNNQLKISAGTVEILLANPRAFEMNRRKLEVDLNRCIGKPLEFEDYTNQRVRIVQDAILRADCMLDIHSTSCDGPAHSLPASCKKSLELAAAMPVSYSIRELAHSTTQGGTTLDFCLENNVAGVAVECGQHKEPGAINTAIACIKAFLAFPDTPVISDITQLECLGSRVVKHGFEFSQDYKGFDGLQPGQLIARYDGGEYRYQEDGPGRIIMPNSDPKYGEDAFYLAREL